jgi:hypothetical protein
MPSASLARSRSIRLASSRRRPDSLHSEFPDWLNFADYPADDYTTRRPIEMAQGLRLKRIPMTKIRA